MREELLEGVCVGATIGLAVVAIRTLLGAASTRQVLALTLAGLVLCGVQLLLSLRRVRRTKPPAKHAPPPAPQRPNRKNLFAQELTRNWTGLNDQPIEEARASTETVQEQSDRQP